LRQAHNLFQRESSTEYDLVLDLYSFSIFSLRYSHSAATDVFVLVSPGSSRAQHDQSTYASCASLCDL